MVLYDLCFFFLVFFTNEVHFFELVKAQVDICVQKPVTVNSTVLFLQLVRVCWFVAVALLGVALYCYSLHYCYCYCCYCCYCWYYYYLLVLLLVLQTQNLSTIEPLL